MELISEGVLTHITLITEGWLNYLKVLEKSASRGFAMYKKLGHLKKTKFMTCHTKAFSA